MVTCSARALPWLADARGDDDDGEDGPRSPGAAAAAQQADGTHGALGISSSREGSWMPSTCLPVRGCTSMLQYDYSSHLDWRLDAGDATVHASRSSSHSPAPCDVTQSASLGFLSSTLCSLMQGRLIHAAPASTVPVAAGALRGAAPIRRAHPPPPPGALSSLCQV